MCIYSPMPHTLSYCALIGKCALIRSNTVDKALYTLYMKYQTALFTKAVAGLIAVLETMTEVPVRVFPVFTCFKVGFLTIYLFITIYLGL